MSRRKIRKGPRTRKPKERPITARQALQAQQLRMRRRRKLEALAELMHQAAKELEQEGGADDQADQASD